MVSETFGNKSMSSEVLDLERIRRGQCSVSTGKREKFGVFDLKVTMQYEVEVECSVKTKKKKKKRKTWTRLDGEEEEEEKKKRKR